MWPREHRLSKSLGGFGSVCGCAWPVDKGGSFLGRDIVRVRVSSFSCEEREQTLTPLSDMVLWHQPSSQILSLLKSSFPRISRRPNGTFGVEVYDQCLALTRPPANASAGQLRAGLSRSSSRRI